MQPTPKKVIYEFSRMSCMYLLHGQVLAHMLGNDMHVCAMKIVSNNFLHVARRRFSHPLIQESVGHACIYLVQDGVATF